MNVLTKELVVLSARDPTKVGLRGIVAMDTFNMLTLDVGGRLVAVEKKGSAFQLQEGRMVITGSDIMGRLEDRLGRPR